MCEDPAEMLTVQPMDTPADYLEKVLGNQGPLPNGIMLWEKSLTIEAITMRVRCGALSQEC